MSDRNGPGEPIPNEVEIVARRTVFQGYFRVDEYRLRHEQFAGGLGPEIKREVLERGHAVAVLPYDPLRDEVVLIQQFRIGPYARGDEACWMFEIVAGIIDPGEGLEEVAHRETLEEANLSLRRIDEIMAYYPSPGAVSEHITLYCGQVDAAGAGGIHGLDHEGEDIRVVPMPFEQAMNLLRDGRITNSPTIIALQWLALNREDLSKRWLSP
jgi:ADP-ribose pyrophosphatase